MGELPSGFRERVYVPGDATVHGALARPDGDETVIVTVGRAADALWPEYRDGMAALGWRVPEAATGLTRSIARVSLAWVFCGEDLETTLVSVTASGGQTRLRIDRTEEYRSWHCILPQPTAAAAESPEPGRFRLLPPPFSGEGSLGACSRYGGGGFSGGTVPTTSSLEELRGHYETQLEQAGWNRVGEADNLQALLSVWRLDRRSATLVLVPIDDAPGCWHLIFATAGR